MEQKYILPSEIRFSQNSISNRFSDALGKEYIGKVLDKICNGDSVFLGKLIDNLKIGKWYQPGFECLWFTVNNRSLWVLKELELLGRLSDRLHVAVDPRGIDPQRFTTQNRGQYVIVRTYPVGGNKAVAANFWRYKQPALEGYGLIQGGGMADYDDGYDSDEYYH